jgi:hypothetical protein
MQVQRAVRSVEARLSFGLIALWCLLAPAHALGDSGAGLTGLVRSAGAPLGHVTVTLYRSGASRSAAAVPLGTGHTGADGRFTITYPTQHPSDAVLYVLVGRGTEVRLASVLGRAPAPGRIVVNERTTVAVAYAFAQFLAGRDIAGPAPGPANAAAMAANLADPRTGLIGRTLAVPPNGNQTSTLATFNTLANLLVPCSRVTRDCAALLRLARPAGEPVPRGPLAALVEIARNPAHHAAALFALAQSGPTPYQPALAPSAIPDAWTLALRFDGDGRSMNGPGNMAIDARGDIWVTDNYTFSRNPLAPVCGGKILIEFAPSGHYVAGSPFSGGGLDGAGFGITLDPHGNVWVGNFGFTSTDCSAKPASTSVSEFSAAGAPLSPPLTDTEPGGFTAGGITFPQGVVSDRRGNIWTANCGNNTLTRYEAGDPETVSSVAPPGLTNPFDLAFNGRGQAFVTGNGNSTVAMINPDGSPALPEPIHGAGIDKPLGIAADSEGNMWVANSRLVDIPCPGMQITPPTTRGSITLISSSGVPASQAPFEGGGLRLPWGVAVDGNDNVWIANFAGQRLSEFCGTNPARCPAGRHTGEPITPPTGYGFDGLTRNTGVQIDPSGNVWVANNWKLDPLPNQNPGGYQLVAFIGLAGPLRTPLIGPPQGL